MTKDVKRDWWLIEPLNEETRQFITASVPNLKLKKQVPCLDGQARDLWLCSLIFLIITLRARQRAMGFDFHAYIQGQDGLASPCDNYQLQESSLEA